MGFGHHTSRFWASRMWGSFPLSLFWWCYDCSFAGLFNNLSTFRFTHQGFSSPFWTCSESSCVTFIVWNQHEKEKSQDLAQSWSPWWSPHLGNGSSFSFCLSRHSDHGPSAKSKGISTGWHHSFQQGKSFSQESYWLLVATLETFKRKQNFKSLGW